MLFRRIWCWWVIRSYLGGVLCWFSFSRMCCRWVRSFGGVLCWFPFSRMCCRWLWISRSYFWSLIRGHNDSARIIFDWVSSFCGVLCRLLFSWIWCGWVMIWNVRLTISIAWVQRWRMVWLIRLIRLIRLNIRFWSWVSCWIWRRIRMGRVEGRVSRRICCGPFVGWIRSWM